MTEIFSKQLFKPVPYFKEHEGSKDDIIANSIESESGKTFT